MREIEIHRLELCRGRRLFDPHLTDELVKNAECVSDDAEGWRFVGLEHHQVVIPIRSPSAASPTPARRVGSAERGDRGLRVVAQGARERGEGARLELDSAGGARA